MTRKRILFVDDEPMVLSGLQRMLRPLRDTWEMEFAEGGYEALKHMEQSPADVVVSDMRMAPLNGAQLLTIIMERWPATVRLVLSGHADRELVAQCVGVAHQYISKPCDPELLKTMIQNAVLLSNHSVSEDLKRVIGSINCLPSMPQVYLELRDALAEDEISLQQIGDILQRDIGMTAKILKLVNSAFFGLRRTMSNPHEAVVYLGADTIKVLVLANSIFNQAKPFETKLFDMGHLWHHCMSVAQAAKAIMKLENLPKNQQDEAFVGGILHDAGVMVLASNLPQQYDNVVRAVTEEKIDLPSAESREFGITHAEVGAYLLGLWGIPASLLKIISLHHHPGIAMDTTCTPLIAVHAADAMSGWNGNHLLFEPTKLDENAIREAGATDQIQKWVQLLYSLSES